MSDPMTALRAADPVDPRDPRLDPAGTAAARVRAGARTGGTPRPIPRRPRHPRLTLGLGGAAVAAGAAVVILGPGGPASPVPAAAALRAAAERAGGQESGRIAFVVDGGAPGGAYRVRARNVLSFDGTDSAMVAETRERGVAGHPGLHVTRTEYRVVGGRAYLRSGGRAPFERVPAGAPARVGAGVPTAGEVLAVLRAAADVRRTAGPGGATTYGGTVSSRALARVGGRVFAAPPGARDAPVRLSAAVGSGGDLRRIVLAARGSTWTIGLSALGEPQRIEAPTAAELG
jgi:hypothetical protein